MVTRPSALLALAVTTLTSTLALADVAPPPDYVETCTVARVARPGLECRSCDAWHGDMNACSKSLGVEGFEHRCRTSGASVWSEVWCRTAAASKPHPEPVPTPPPATSPAPNDPAVFAEPAPVATLAVSPTDVPASTAEPPQPATPYALPTEPPPGPRGCGGCAVDDSRSTSMVTGLLLALGALGGGLRLRGSSRRRNLARR